MNKTIKEMADDLHVDKQKVYRYIKSNHINEAHQKGKTKYYDDVAQDQIKRAFAEKSESHQTASKSTSEAHHEALNEALNEALVDTVKMLQNELKVKNEQIENLHTLLDQEQKLRLIAEDKINAIEAKPEEPKKRFFSFFFKKD